MKYHTKCVKAKGVCNFFKKNEVCSIHVVFVIFFVLWVPLYDENAEIMNLHLLKTIRCKFEMLSIRGCKLSKVMYNLFFCTDCRL